MKILADENIPFIDEYFSTSGDLVLKPGRAITAYDVRDANMLIVRSITNVDEALLRDSKVQFVGSVTAGTDHVDIDWLQQTGIDFAFAPGFNAPPVADYVVSVIAAMQRKRLLAKDGVRAAVVGVGNVGSLVVQCLKLLNFDVVVCDPIRAENEAGFISTALSEIKDVDLISLHVPLTCDGKYPTHDFINKDFLQKQKPGCILINASRGSIINSTDLIQYGSQLVWCFDVWEHEPLIDKSILSQAAVATSHIAGYSVQSKIRGIDMIYRAACERKLIKEKNRTLHGMPTQTLTFAGDNHHWQDVVLGIFNPIIMTAMMRSLLLPATNYGLLFDEMRHKFTFRHEFASTMISDISLSEEDKKILNGLCIKFN